jgi:DNA repair protein SbcC/Rad50
MRLNHLVLENFRCFRSQRFDLSADILAIYGRNGTGKTAFFDAIEFCLTGEIARFRGEKLPPRGLVNAFSDNGAKVRLQFDSDEQDWIEVSLTGATATVRCGSGERSRKDFLFSKLTDEAYLPPRKELAPLIELFRATILLSQASMRGFIETTPSERSGTVANLAGAAYLQRCLEKAGSVFEEGKRREREVTSALETTLAELQLMNQQVKDREGRLAALQASVNSGTTVAILAVAFTAIAPETAVHMDFDAFRPEELASTLSGFAEERLHQTRTLLAAFAAIETRLPQHWERLRRKADEEGNLQNLRDQLSTFSETARQCAERVASAQSTSDERRRQILLIEGALDRLKRIAELRQARSELQSRESAEKENIRKIIHECELRELAVADLLAIHDDAKTKLALTSDQIVFLTNKAAALQKLQAELREYSVREQEIAACKRSRKEGADTIPILETEVQELRQQGSALQERSALLKEQLSQAAAEQSQLAQALVTLQPLIRDGVCPLCGHRHESDDLLHLRINERLASISDGVVKLQVEAQDLATRASVVRMRTQEIESQLRTRRDALSHYDHEIKILLDANEATAAILLQLNLPPDIDVVNSALNDIAGRLSSQQEELRANREKLNVAEERGAEARAALQTLTGRLNAHQAALREIVMKRDEILAHLLASPVSENLEDRIANEHERLATSRLSHQEQLEVVQRLEAEHSICLQRLREVEVRIRTTEGNLTELNADVATVVAGLDSLGLAHNATLEVFRQAQEQCLDAERHLAKFSELVQGFRTQLTREALERDRDQLQRQSDDLSSRKENLKKMLTKINTAIAECSEWVRQLSVAVKKSVSHRLNQHRIESFRLFQSMIPTPYLFEDITVKQTDAGVSLGLKYRDVGREVGEPKFFLSSAQSNTLALAYFLSFACRQHWCRLRAILLDDPVQHLDDLDAVAFLDLLRTVAVSERQHRRQIIISTCDQNLYGLLIRKFSSIPADELHFAALSFHDIGPAGPTVRCDYSSRTSSRAA